MSKPIQNVKKPQGGTGPYNEELFETFVGWSILTKKERLKCGITTARAFADRHEIHESHLSRWKLRTDFKTIKEARLREKLQELTPDVLEAFHKRCIKYGMSNDVEFWMILIEKWDRKKVSAQEPEIRFGENDIRTLISNLPPDKQKLYYVTLARLIADAKTAQTQLNKIN